MLGVPPPQAGNSHELPIGHNAMVIAPKQVAQIIQAVLPPEGAMADRP